jgi:SAM-dependent methyltransferase
MAGLRVGDLGLLTRCGPMTLDVGCGPGRLAAALARAGRSALGVDVSAEAVRQARRRGARAIRRSVFEELPDEGAWDSVLLADGNIGIGGDPVTLLRRCRQLLGTEGDVLVELGPPRTLTWTGHVRLRYADRQSQPFAWATVAAGDVRSVATHAGYAVCDSWTEGSRWFAHLRC